MRNTQHRVLPGLVDRSQPTQTSPVPGDVSHAEINHGVDLAVQLGGEFLYQQILQVGLGQGLQLCLRDPSVGEQRRLYAVWRGEVGMPLKAFN